MVQEGSMPYYNVAFTAVHSGTISVFADDKPGAAKAVREEISPDEANLFAATYDLHIDAVTPEQPVEVG
jgi:hypothetical protein